jgi:hypothetical protein
VLIYYPEGELRSPDGGIEPFDPDALERLARLYPDAHWWPFALHVTWEGHARPTAFLSGGPSHSPDGTEHDRLTTLWASLQEPSPSPQTVVLDGRRSAAETWSFSFAASFFKRYL